MNVALIVDVAQAEHFLRYLHLAAQVLCDMADTIIRNLQLFDVHVPA